MPHKKIIVILALIIFALTLVFFLYNNTHTAQNVPVNQELGIVNQEPSSQDSGIDPNIKLKKIDIPLDRAEERVTKKPFGIFITPQDSPVQPEKFRGYHTGVDYEIFAGEESIAVPVRAICTGNLLEKRFASGYGGVAVQQCQINNENVTVVYGHLSLSSIIGKIGSEIKREDLLGNLGNPNKGETDDERKHLHLSIHRGNVINIKGYVNSKAELAGWIDPCLYFCK